MESESLLFIIIYYINICLYQSFKIYSPNIMAQGVILPVFYIGYTQIKFYPGNQLFFLTEDFHVFLHSF